MHRCAWTKRVAYEQRGRDVQVEVRSKKKVRVKVKSGIGSVVRLGLFNIGIGTGARRLGGWEDADRRADGACDDDETRERERVTIKKGKRENTDARRV